MNNLKLIFSICATTLSIGLTAYAGPRGNSMPFQSRGMNSQAFKNSDGMIHQNLGGDRRTPPLIEVENSDIPINQPKYDQDNLRQVRAAQLAVQGEMPLNKSTDSNYNTYRDISGNSQDEFNLDFNHPYLVHQAYLQNHLLEWNQRNSIMSAPVNYDYNPRFSEYSMYPSNLNDQFDLNKAIETNTETSFYPQEINTTDEPNMQVYMNALRGFSNGHSAFPDARVGSTNLSTGMVWYFQDANGNIYSLSGLPEEGGVVRLLEPGEGTALYNYTYPN